MIIYPLRLFSNSQNKHPLIVFFNFGRSGGTLLNRMLGSYQDILILSEINPLGGGRSSKNIYSTISQQAWHWHRVLLLERDFFSALKQLHHHLQKNNKFLILRDWSYVNFAHNIKNDVFPPNQLLVYEGLKEYPTIYFALVRDAIDVWISFGKPEINQFSKDYLKYAQEISKKNIMLFKYEDLCKYPSKTMKRIFAHIKINYTDDYKYFYKVTKVNGDSQNLAGKFNNTKISFTKRKYLTAKEICTVTENKNIIEANKLFGYSTEYFSNGMTQKIYKQMSSDHNH